MTSLTLAALTLPTALRPRCPVSAPLGCALPRWQTCHRRCWPITPTCRIASLGVFMSWQMRSRRLTRTHTTRPRALERFLQQYPYSLDPTILPPAGADPVDHFLFELKQGYCDYYASAMVVLARTVGLPARFASGYAVQPADEAGRQTIYRINAHSWAEIYFAGFGWIEFEPTAGFAAQPSAGSARDWLSIIRPIRRTG